MDYFLHHTHYYFFTLMHHHVFFPLMNFANVENMDPEVGDMPLVTKRRDNVEIGCALSNSFGFGGTNASLTFTSLRDA